MSLFPEVLSRPITVNKVLPIIQLDYDTKGQFSEFNIQVSKKPLPTITKGNRHHFFADFGQGKRKLKISEIKLFNSFPPPIKFFGKDNKNWGYIGNSVPPMFMRAIALQIKHKMWGGKPLQPYPKSMNYLEILEAAWQDHLKPREPNAPTVISTFAGCGGSSLGYSMAGYKELLAVEWNDNAVETFKLNFPGVPVYHGDIAKLSVDECMRLAGLTEPGQLDLLDGSPPCQGFSTAGKRILNDPRNQLFREYVRLLRGLKPKVFVMENVSGLVKGKMKLVFAEIMRELKASGYQVKCQLMNAMYFYVPQSRQRLIFIGVRDDLGIEGSLPGPESRPIECKETYSGGGQQLTGIELLRWQNIPPGGNWQNLSRHLINGKAKYSNFHRKLHPNKPSFTLGKEEHFSSGRFYHWNEPRHINDVELMRIGSFPDMYKIIKNGKELHRRIGNSVPPLFMRSIARHIKREILEPVLLTP